MSHTSIYSFAAGILFAAHLFAQVSPHGTVLDPQGKPITGASLVLYRSGLADPVARAQSVNGEFVFAEVPAGEYLLEAAADGFRRVSRRIDGHSAVIVKLELAGIDQRIVVTAEGAAQTIDQVSKAATVIGAAEIAQRNEYSLVEALRDE